MDESCYGLIVEGSYDGSVFPEFVRKIVSAELRVIVRLCGGVSKLMSRLPGYLKELEHAWYGKPVIKAIVIRDWQHRDLTKAEQEMAQRVRGRSFAFAHGVQFCPVRQEMETWLLADEGAINAVAVSRAGRQVSQVQGELEEIADAKSRLVTLLSEARLPYDATVCAEIAQHVNLERLRYRCPSFRLFETKVLDC